MSILFESFATSVSASSSSKDACATAFSRNTDEKLSASYRYISTNKRDFGFSESMFTQRS